MRCDLHVHTYFSCDSKADFASYCEQALARDLDCVCFTDHLDHNPRDQGLGFYDAPRCRDAFLRAKEQYGGKLTLLWGVEFAEPHIYPRQLEEIHRQPYDFILGSIHFWMRDLFASEVAPAGISMQESYAVYWDTVENAVSHGGFDSLAHLDLPKRYTGELVYDTEKMLRIFQIMAQKEIALELNSSSLRRGHQEAMPGPTLLALYKQAGGCFVTMGSDAHVPQDLYAGLPLLRAAAQTLGLTEIYYTGRERRAVAPDAACGECDF